jgi:hypothetical protein
LFAAEGRWATAGEKAVFFAETVKQNLERMDDHAIRKKILMRFSFMAGGGGLRIRRPLRPGSGGYGLSGHSKG